MSKSANFAFKYEQNYFICTDTNKNIKYIIDMENCQFILKIGKYIVGDKADITIKGSQFTDLVEFIKCKESSIFKVVRGIHYTGLCIQEDNKIIYFERNKVYILYDPTKICFADTIIIYKFDNCTIMVQRTKEQVKMFIDNVETDISSLNNEKLNTYVNDWADKLLASDSKIYYHNFDLIPLIRYNTDVTKINIENFTKFCELFSQIRQYTV